MDGGFGGDGRQRNVLGGTLALCSEDPVTGQGVVKQARKTTVCIRFAR